MEKYAIDSDRDPSHAAEDINLGPLRHVAILVALIGYSTYASGQ